jgi:hypothetical protein
MGGAVRVDAPKQPQEERDGGTEQTVEHRE